MQFQVIEQDFSVKNKEIISFFKLLGGIPAASISISSLTSHHVEQNLTSANQSVPTDFEKALNDQADFREYLIKFTIHFSILTANSIKLQASALAQLTQTTNQLTRTTLVINLFKKKSFFFISKLR